MLHDHDGVAFVGQAAERAQEPRRGQRVEVRQRLVDDVQLRREHQDAGHREELALTAGECRRLAAEQVLDPGGRRYLRDPLAHLAPGHAQVLGAEGELRLDRRAHDLAGRVLEDGPDVQRDVAQALLGRQRPGDPHRSDQLTGIGVRDQAVHGPDQRALAAARGPGHEQHLARVDGHGQVIQGRFGGASVPEGEALDLDDRVGHRQAAGQAGRIVTGRSTAAPSLRAASAWLSAKARRPKESS